MKALVFDRIGPPLEVLALRDVPMPKPGTGEILVKLSAASINPGDFLFIQGLYPAPKIPRFPQQIAGTGGGVGVVVEAGAGVSLPPGTLVSFTYSNAWAEYAVLPTAWAVPLPADYPRVKGAQFGNVISALDLLEMSRLEAGQWLALTAANSTVATIVSQLARRKGICTLSIIRRSRPDFDLRLLGAEAVLELDTLENDLPQAVQRITDGRGLNAVIDCVGGPNLGDLVRSATMGAQVIVYGGFSAERFELHNFDLLLKAIDIRSYAYRYFFDPPAAADLVELWSLAEATAHDSFKVPVGGWHALDDFNLAIKETLDRPERGKRFLVMSDE